MNKLIYCFYQNTTCDFFKSILTSAQWNTYTQLLESNLPSNQLSFFTSVNDAQISGKWISQMLLKYFTRNSNFEALNSTECNKDSESFKNLIQTNGVTITHVNFVNNATCLATALYSVSSVSPAFDRYAEGLLVDTDKFSAWTESSWTGKNIQMRLFMFTCDTIKISTILVGVFVFIISIVVTFLSNKYSDKLLKVSNTEQIAEFIDQ